MSNFENFIDSIVDETGELAKNELKDLISVSKNDASDFVRIQAENFERWTEKLADNKLSVKGYVKLVKKMEILTEIESIRLEVAAKASAQRLSDGIQDIVINKLFKLL